jgi:hypothetical protein
MVDVTPKLRQLLDMLASERTSHTTVPALWVVGGTDKLARRSRQNEGDRRQPKSVCTSLRDICEM